MDDLKAKLSPCVASMAVGLQWIAATGQARPVTRALPEEMPMSFIIDGVPSGVMIVTPSDYEDMAYGFALTEGFVNSCSQLSQCQIIEQDDGIYAHITLAPSTVKPERQRAMIARSGCGRCGFSEIEAAIRPIDSVAKGFSMRPENLHRAFKALSAHQPLNEHTRAVHGAAFASQRGEIIMLREDIGRHNALDKLIGALMRAGQNPAHGALLLTSRASYEMVDKAARAGIGLLAAISAPSALALRKAEFSGITLAAIARDDGFMVLSHPERLELSSQ